MQFLHLLHLSKMAKTHSRSDLPKIDAKSAPRFIYLGRCKIRRLKPDTVSLGSFYFDVNFSPITETSNIERKTICNGSSGCFNKAA